MNSYLPVERKRDEDRSKTCVLVVNGYLSHDEDDISQWIPGVNMQYPRSAIYHVRWPAMTYDDIEPLLLGLNGPTVLLTIIINTFKQGGAWLEAVLNADESGVLLAKRIVRDNHFRKFVLMGNSLGARVILRMLEVLPPEAKRKIGDVHFLGGAVDTVDEGWSQGVSGVSGKVYNYYSKNDGVLKYLYGMATFFRSEPIGRSKLTTSSKAVRNVNVSWVVKGHMEYKKKLARYILGPKK